MATSHRCACSFSHRPRGTGIRRLIGGIKTNQLQLEGKPSKGLVLFVPMPLTRDRCRQLCWPVDSFLRAVSGRLGTVFATMKSSSRWHHSSRASWPPSGVILIEANSRDVNHFSIAYYSLPPNISVITRSKPLVSGTREI